MKFKAAFSDQGLGSLCKGESACYLHGPVHLCCRETTVCFSPGVSAGLLPALDKFGKTCQLLLGPQDVHFVQTSQDTDGVRITACWSTVNHTAHCMLPFTGSLDQALGPHMYMQISCAGQAELVHPDSPPHAVPAKQAVWGSDRLVPTDSPQTTTLAAGHAL